MKYLSRILIVAFLTAFAGTAYAQCLPHEIAVQNLEKSYGEKPVGLGVAPQGRQVLELFVSETGTWTILMTQTNGMSCITASGTSWTDLPRLAVTDEKPI